MKLPHNRAMRHKILLRGNQAVDCAGSIPAE